MSTSTRPSAKPWEFTIFCFAKKSFEDRHFRLLNGFIVVAIAVLVVVGELLLVIALGGEKCGQTGRCRSICRIRK